MMIPSFAVDVMCIKPFDEGTGRLARLFSLLLMEKAGFDVGRYVSVGMNKHIEYYEGNDQISSGFEFIEKLVDAWFSPDAIVADLEKKTLDSGRPKE